MTGSSILDWPERELEFRMHNVSTLRHHQDADGSEDRRSDTRTREASDGSGEVYAQGRTRCKLEGWLGGWIRYLGCARAAYGTVLDQVERPSIIAERQSCINRMTDRSQECGDEDTSELGVGPVDGQDTSGVGRRASGGERRTLWKRASACGGRDGRRAADRLCKTSGR